ncbi:hypothetical protein WAF17_10170 [Bernardetia sp. ABR2-2B]|uniref:hypothetical protein n=1 Tax=Bernardetia sp. ABR2-2B TaxID=3127472 RepID=UPI0030D4031F
MIKYKLILLIIFFGLAFISCKSNIKSEKLIGNLHYQTVLVPRSLYNMPDSVVDKIELRYASLPNSTIAKDTLLSIIINRNLKNNPYIFLRKKDGEIVTIYMEKPQYQEFTRFKYKELIAKEQKVVIKLKADKLMGRYYKCISIKSVKIEKGKTLGKQGKFLFYEYE